MYFLSDAGSSLGILSRGFFTGRSFESREFIVILVISSAKNSEYRQEFPAYLLTSLLTLARNFGFKNEPAITSLSYVIYNPSALGL